MSAVLAPAPISSAPLTTMPTLAGGRDVHLRGVSIEYRSGVDVVRPIEGLDLYAASGRVTALLGRSGSGKTSLLSCVAATLRPAAGSIWLGGIEVSTLTGRALDEYRRRHVGVIHQAYNLIASLSAVENVEVPLRLNGVKRGEARARATAILDELGLADRAGHRPSELSGGQQQRVAVARALASTPSVVLADEPTAHLDGGSVQPVRDLLRSIASRGCTVLVATHDDRLLDVADQVIQLGGS